MSLISKRCGVARRRYQLAKRTGHKALAAFWYDKWGTYWNVVLLRVVEIENR